MNGRVTTGNTNLQKLEIKYNKKDQIDEFFELEEFEIPDGTVETTPQINFTKTNVNESSNILNSNTNNILTNIESKPAHKNNSTIKSTNNNFNNIFSVFNNSSLLNQNQTYKIESKTSSIIEPINNNQTESNIKLTGFNVFNINTELSNFKGQRENTYPKITNLVNNSINCSVTSNRINSKRQDETNFFSSRTKLETNSSSKSTLFLEYSYREDSNSKYRNTMEDFSKIIENFMSDPNNAFFSLYDGHGGADPVKYAKERMPDLFSKYLEPNAQNQSNLLNSYSNKINDLHQDQNKDKDISQVLETTFNKLDDELKFTDAENSGCTACVIYLTAEGNKRYLYVANVGDTRAILISKDSAQRLTYDDKCTDQSEVERIKQKGGSIINGRVSGQLVLTRALGDHALKKYGVVSTPHTKKIEVNYSHTYIVIASDGIWDVLNDEDVAHMALNKKSSGDFATSLISTALKKGSRDNLSVITIKLN